MPSTPLIFLALLLLATLVGCKKDDSAPNYRLQIEQQQLQISELASELDQLREVYGAALARQAQADADTDAARKEAAGAQVEKMGLEETLEEQSLQIQEITEQFQETHHRHLKEIETLKKEFQDYQRRYRISLRKKAPGTHFEQIAYRGKEYSQITVKAATPGGIEISHNHGVAHLEFAHLSPEIREQFGYNKAESEAHRTATKISEREQIAKQHAHKAEVAAEQLERHQRIAWHTWQKTITRAEEQISYQKKKVIALRSQLQQTRPGSASISRLQNDIQKVEREIATLERDLREKKLDPPLNPDAAKTNPNQPEAVSSTEPVISPQNTTTDPFADDPAEAPPKKEQNPPSTVAEFLRRLEEENQ